MLLTKFVAILRRQGKDRAAQALVEQAEQGMLDPAGSSPGVSGISVDVDGDPEQELPQAGAIRAAFRSAIDSVLTAALDDGTMTTKDALAKIADLMEKCDELAPRGKNYQITDAEESRRLRGRLTESARRSEEPPVGAGRLVAWLKN